jgi:hypothetical protein
MNLGKLLGSVAPLLATAIGGPVGGLAVQVLGEALGISEPTQDKVEKAFASGSMTGDQVAAVRQAEIRLKQRSEELGIDLEQIHAKDRESARQMQIQTKSRIPAVLAILITIGFFGVLGGMLSGQLQASGNNEALLILLGALGAAWGAVVNFYFGSSAGSAAKNEMLAKR